ncbi:aldo/keto reductase [Companilactobacillus ginsenosidimutans]|uniref:Aldo/keto reductase n=1 Tax=Companilactobacillus ginsenosidimutans TaxID=1007676 RepID=A0A0H4QNU5_9LACO|nr:aldo/keto reductase [Companilactobacillus ginsenosidimutans]AKP68458.1 aldo/keto reductase [Companilactobacillus ginsenosidimutans]
MGTWRVGEGDLLRTQKEVEILKYGLQNGINVIDTAEMYGEGKAETVVGRAIKNFDRDSFQLISKFYPYHATPKLIKDSLEKSLKRLNTDYLDVYLLHWRGDTPLAETVQGLEAVKKEGLIKSWGVSNFSTSDLEELASVPDGENCQVNQDLYNLTSRGVEYSILPYQKKHNIDFMGYSPFGSDGNEYLNLKDEVGEVAAQKHISIFELLLAWVIRNNNVLSIPKTSSVDHFAMNLHAADIEFTPDELELLDKIYPKPTEETPLDTI